jgi:DNA-binding NtrC family response regulator
MKDKRTAFVVDDDTTYAEAIRLNMEKLGFEVRCFSSGAGLMAQLSASPDLIILDHDLGEEVSGLEYLQKVKEVARKIPVLFLLAQNDIKAAVQALRFGAFGYLEKHRAIGKLRTSIDDLDIEKKRKFDSALKAFRQSIFRLYNIN